VQEAAVAEGKSHGQYLDIPFYRLFRREVAGGVGYDRKRLHKTNLLLFQNIARVPGASPFIISRIKAENKNIL
jgi:hypothetical protein